MALVYAGIDEAGYGPLLGPLCVGLVVLRVDDWAPGRPAPDLWQALAPAVARTPGEARGRFAIADSKSLKLPNGGKAHPLTHLERGCLACLHAWRGGCPETDQALFESLAADLGPAPWYAGEPSGVPVTTTADGVAIDANVLAGAMRRAGVRLERLACLVVPEARFNDLVRQGGKGATTLWAMGRHARTVLEHHAGDDVRIVCDRLGGRTRYGEALARALGIEEPTVVDESACVSAYDCAAGERTARVLFQPEAERAHLPVALASMFAKLVRELAMARFNRYWSARIAGLRPTAGYTTDARRWLADAGAALSPEERSGLVRRA